MIGRSFDPCREGGFGENVCDMLKFKNIPRGLRILYFILIGAGIIAGDALVFIPQIPILIGFPLYYWINLFVDVGILIIFAHILGVPTAVALPKLFDSLFVFALAPMFPALAPVAYFMELIPWFTFALCTYLIYKALVKNQPVRA